MRYLLSLAVCAVLAGCSLGSSEGGYFDNDGPPSALGHLKALGSDEITIKVEQPHKWANRPYTVMGKRYVPVTGDKPMNQVGEASWYGKQFHGKKTSTGEIYDMYELSAAHPTMELPSYARVTNLKNGRSVIVRVNDRGPFLRGRIIDLSYAAAVRLGYQKEGTTRVRVERITRKDIAAGRIPSTNSSDATLVAAAVVSSIAERSSSSRSNTWTSSQKSSSGSTSTTSTSSTASRSNSYSTSPARQTTAARPVSQTQTHVPAAAAAQPAQRTPVTAQSEQIDEMNAVVAETTDPGEPAVSISLTVEETGTDEAAAIENYHAAQASQAPAPNAADSADPISAIVAEQNAIDAQKAQSNDTAAVMTGWTVQLGAFGVADNAKAAAAHAEMMFSQQQVAFGSVRVIDTGTVYRVVVGNAPSRQEAIALARRVSTALGASAYAIAEPVPKKLP